MENTSQRHYLVALTTSNFIDLWHQNNAALPLQADKNFMNKFLSLGMGNQSWKTVNDYFSPLELNICQFEKSNSTCLD